MKPEILYEDEYMLACVKPCGVPSQSDKSNDEDMVSIIKNYIFEKSDDNAEPYVAVIHRLDKPVGGVMIFAKTKDAAARLSDMMQDGEIVKYYQAVLTGELPDFDGELIDYMVRDAKTNTSKIVPKDTKGAKKAVLHYEVLDVFETDEGVLSYVLIELETGRHHQIRVQMASRGCGIWGDVKYNPRFSGGKNGGKQNGKSGGGSNGKMPGQFGGKQKSKGSKFTQIGLYSSRIELTHPFTGEELVFKSEPTGQAFDVIEMEDF
jgi:23S rRNA pseudouridine1911/1915/1917 synthase